MIHAGLLVEIGAPRPQRCPREPSSAAGAEAVAAETVSEPLTAGAWSCYCQRPAAKSWLMMQFHDVGRRGRSFFHSAAKTLPQRARATAPFEHVRRGTPGSHRSASDVSTQPSPRARRAPMCSLAHAPPPGPRRLAFGGRSTFQRGRPEGARGGAAAVVAGRLVGVRARRPALAPSLRRGQLAPDAQGRRYFGARLRRRPGGHRARLGPRARQRQSRGPCHGLRPRSVGRQPVGHGRHHGPTPGLGAPRDGRVRG